MSTLPKPFVFVLMPFDKQFADIYKFGIKGAADDVGAYAERVDEQVFIEGILDRIFNQISKADVIVADMTGRNANVFYEVGYAHALGKTVLLLTQNSDDIPFDLKHRPHIVYGGQIDALRKELGPRLDWAVVESRKQHRAGGSERFSLRLNGVDIPPVALGDAVDLAKLPLFKGQVPSPALQLAVHVRNESLEAILGITHIYLFCKKGTGIVPSVMRVKESDWLSSFTAFHAASPSTMPVPAKPFSASPVDAPDGLTQQYRLKVTFPAMPPGAVEESAIPMIFVKGQSHGDFDYRLRLHSPTQYTDFRFRLDVALTPSAGPQSPPQAPATATAPPAQHTLPVKRRRKARGTR